MSIINFSRLPNRIPFSYDAKKGHHVITITSKVQIRLFSTIESVEHAAKVDERHFLLYTSGRGIFCMVKYRGKVRREFAEKYVGLFDSRFLLNPVHQPKRVSFANPIKHVREFA